MLQNCFFGWHPNVSKNNNFRRQHLLKRKRVYKGSKSKDIPASKFLVKKGKNIFLAWRWVWYHALLCQQGSSCWQCSWLSCSGRLSNQLFLLDWQGNNSYHFYMQHHKCLMTHKMAIYPLPWKKEEKARNEGKLSKKQFFKFAPKRW